MKLHIYPDEKTAEQFMAFADRYAEACVHWNGCRSFSSSARFTSREMTPPASVPGRQKNNIFPPGFPEAKIG